MRGTCRVSVTLALAALLGPGLVACGAAAVGQQEESGSPAPATPSEAILTGGTGVATLTWDAPVENTDGSQLVDLAGFRIYVGSESGRHVATVDVGNRTEYSFTTLRSGRYFFTLEAYNAFGLASTLSEEVSFDVP